MRRLMSLVPSSPTRPDSSLRIRYELTRELGRSSSTAQTDVRVAIGRCTTLLTGLHITDVDVIAPTSPRRLLRSASGIAVLLVVLGGVVAATALVNLVPAAIVAAVSVLVRTPVTKGTVRVLVGLVAFPAAWITAGLVTADGFAAVLLVVATSALGAFAAIWLVERSVALAQMLFRGRAQLERVRSVELATGVRDEVVGAVTRAVAMPRGLSIRDQGQHPAMSDHAAAQSNAPEADPVERGGSRS